MRTNEERARDYLIISEELSAGDTAKSNLYWRKSQEFGRKIADPKEILMYELKKYIRYVNKHDVPECQKILDKVRVKLNSDSALRINYYLAEAMLTLVTKTNDLDNDTEAVNLENQLKKAFVLMTNNVEDQARYYYLLTSLYYYSNQKAKLVAIANDAATCYERCNARTRGKNYKSLGQYLGGSGYTSKAFEAYVKAHKGFAELRDSIQLAGMIITLNKRAFKVPTKEREVNFTRAIGILNRNKGLNPKLCANFISGAYTHLAMDKMESNEKEPAMDCWRKSLFYKKLEGNAWEIPLVLGNMGDCYLQFGMVDSALIVYNISMALRKEMDISEGIMYNHHSLAEVYMAKKNYREAIKYEHTALRMGLENHQHDYDDEFYKVLMQAYQAIGDYKNAFYYSEKFHRHHDSVDLLSNTSEIDKIKSELNEEKLRAEFESEKTRQRLEQEKRDMMAQEERKIKNLYIFLGSVIAAGLLVIVVIVVRSLRITRLQKKEIEEQKKMVDEKQKEVMDSIRYAQRIQKALITSENYIEKQLKKFLN